MGMSEFYGARDDAESIATIHRSIDLGIDLLRHGRHVRAVRQRRAPRSGPSGQARPRDRVATKFGNVRGTDGSFRGINGSPEYVRSCADASLQRLGVDHIDLYYQHRVDTKVPIEDTVGAMARARPRGKGAIPRTLRGGARHDSAGACRAPHQRSADRVFAVEPRARGRHFPDGARARNRLRRVQPARTGLLERRNPQPRRFRAGRPSAVFSEVSRREFRPEPVARGPRERRSRRRKGVTPSQLALSWVLAQGADIVPIPGTKRRAYLEQNAKAADIELTTAELSEIDVVAPRGSAVGDRYPDMSTVNR